MLQLLKDLDVVDAMVHSDTRINILLIEPLEEDLIVHVLTRSKVQVIIQPKEMKKSKKSNGNHIIKPKE